MPDVTLKLTLGSFAVEVSGPQEYADAKFEELVARYTSGKGASGSESRPQSQASSSMEVQGKKLSASELIKKSNARNQSDIAVVLGYFMEKNSGIASFTSTELGNLAKETKRPFANSSDLVAKLTARGLMMSAGEKEGQRAYAITASGEEYVESMLQSERS